MSVRVNLAELIYPQQCVEAAIRAYMDLCSVKVLRLTEDGCCVEIRGLQNVDERQLVNEFLNYVLDLSLEKHLQPS